MIGNNIELYVYDRELNFKGVIDIYTSLRWRRKYFEAGEFEIHLQATNENINFFKSDDIILRENCLEAGLVKRIEISEETNKTELIINGRFLSYLLYRRIVKHRINFTGKILDGMRKVLEQMTPFSILEIENTEIPSDNITFQVTYKNVYNHIKKLALASNVGFRIVPDIENKRLLFQNYVGIDKSTKQKLNPSYEFSEEYSNITKANYLKDSSTICNYVLVGGEGEGTQRVLVEIDNTQGLHDFDVVETFVDAKGESKGELSDDEYRQILEQKGTENIEDITENINFDVYVDDYKEKWDLGDIVTVKKESWGIEEDLRITEVEEVIEGNKISVTPTFGTPLAETYIEDDK